MNHKKHAARARARKRNEYLKVLDIMAARQLRHTTEIRQLQGELARARREGQGRKDFPIDAILEHASRAFGAELARNLYKIGDFRALEELQRRPVRIPRPCLQGKAEAQWIDDAERMVTRVDVRVPPMSWSQYVDPVALEILREEQARNRREATANVDGASQSRYS